MRIAVLANIKENAPYDLDDSPGRWDELDSDVTVKGIVDALVARGHESEFFEASLRKPFSVSDKLEKYRPDLCFNIAEGHIGASRESHIPALLEMMGIPYTGGQVLCLAIGLDKPMTKRILRYHELPTPEFQVFAGRDEEINEDLVEGDELRFPLFLKPSREGTGIGVSREGLVRTSSELRNVLAEMLARYKQPILCERYVEGRDVTVGIVGNIGPTEERRLNDRTSVNNFPAGLKILPPLEIDTAPYVGTEGRLYTNRMKVEFAEDHYAICPADLSSDAVNRLARLAAATFRVIGCTDVARVDFRLDEYSREEPLILEINPLPGLNPKYSDLVLEAYAAGMSYEDLIDSILSAALSRYDLTDQGRKR